MTFEERLKEWELRFNETEEDIADYLLAHREGIMELSIQKIASELYIAPNSIMRFAKKLGYSGFAELKFTVGNEGKFGKKTLSRQLMELLPQNIVKTLDLIEEPVLEKVAAVMRKAGCCIFAGVGDSEYFCEMLGKNLRCIDYKVQYYHQIHDMIYAVEHGDAGDALVIISARGENQRLVALARRGKEKGMKVVSLTHMCENPLALAADYRLYFWGENRMVQGYNVTDRTGLMVLVRLLSEAIWRGYE